MTLLSVKEYNQSYSLLWDEFLDRCRNSLFLFKRQYMEYHKDRFVDHSLMFFEGNRLLAVLPASIKNNQLYSHAGLTFGGFLYPAKLGVCQILDIFDCLISYLKKNHFTGLTYKLIPSIFHEVPTEEDLFALYTLGARIAKRELSTAVSFENQIKFSKGKREGVKKAIKHDLCFRESTDFEKLFEIGSKIMKDRHDLAPVHNSNEMKYLKSIFPENIRMFEVSNENEMLACTLIYEYGNTIHTQYMYNTDMGLSCGALDFLMDQVIQKYRNNKKFLSFGISTEDGGKKLNIGLQRQKEMFGGRSILHDTYELSV
ncbi:hypothetical protein OAQ34_03855 [Opitutales bacterium]|nr:hypothetical protein [Opitutales bacterium]